MADHVALLRSVNLGPNRLKMADLRASFEAAGFTDPRTIVQTGNVLFELDGQSALALYKQYLGEHARDLPASGLLFPLSVRRNESGDPVYLAGVCTDVTERRMTEERLRQAHRMESVGRLASERFHPLEIGDGIKGQSIRLIRSQKPTNAPT